METDIINNSAMYLVSARGVMELRKHVISNRAIYC